MTGWFVCLGEDAIFPLRSPQSGSQPLFTVKLVLTFFPLQTRRRASASGGSAAKVFEARPQKKSKTTRRGEFFAAYPTRLLFGNSGLLGSPSFGYFSWRDKKSN
jgi:hypothetical protein